MKKYIYLLCGSALLCCHSCRSGIASGADTASQTITPLQQTRSVEAIAQEIDQVQFVPIADDRRTYTSTLIKMLLDEGKNIYMLDDQGNLAAIKPDGTFLTTVARRGRAANEYMSISDVAIDGREFMILDGTKVKCFDLDDPKKVRTIDIPVDVPCDALAPDSHGGIYLFSAFPRDYTDTRSDDDFLLYRISAEGELAAQYIKREDNTLSLNNISQSRTGEYYLRPQNSSHIFYRLADRGPEPEYRVDFGQQNIPHRYFFDSAAEDLGEYITSPYYKLPMELHETSSHLFFRVAGPQARETSVVYDKRTKKGIRWENEPVDMQMQILASDGEWFYAVMPQTIEGNQPHGPLYRYVNESLKAQQMSPAQLAHIVKIRFAKL